MRSLRFASIFLALLGCSSEHTPSSNVDAGVATAKVERSPLDVARTLVANDARIAKVLRGEGGFTRDGDAFVSAGHRATAQGEFDQLGVRVHATGAPILETGISRVARLQLRWTPIDAAEVTPTLVDGHIVIRDVHPSTDAIIASSAWEAEELFVLRDAGAPASFTWKIERAKGLPTVRTSPDGSIWFADGSGAGRLHISVPYAIDAHGLRRNAKMHLVDDELRIELDSSGLEYPILLDPAVDASAWELMAATSLGAISGAKVAYNSNRSKVFMFGGQVSGGGKSNKLATWSGSSWDTGFLGSVPFGAARDGHVWESSAGPQLYLYGGTTTGVMDDLWIYRGDTTAWYQDCGGSSGVSCGIPARTDAAGAFLLGQGFIVFGGRNGSTTYDDTWRYFAAPFQNVTAGTKPWPRYAHAIVAEPVSGKLIMFGGRNDGWATTWGDTWDYQASSGVWTQRCSACGPEPRYTHGMAYDTVRKKVVMFGGYSPAYGDLGDTWEYDPVAFTWKATCGTGSAPPCFATPGIRDSGPLAFDPNRKRVVLAGGYHGGYLSDSWEYHGRGASCTTSATCDTGYCVDGVCCESSGCGTCQACNTAAKPGACNNVPVGPGAGCSSTTSACDGAGVCKLNNGQTCSGASVCLSGFCADNVCCNSACNKACDVCAAVLGASANGTCTPAPKTYAGSPTCAGGLLCNGTSADCPGGCTADADCSAGTFCATDGTCKAQKAIGTTCDPTAECKGGSCRICQPPSGSTTGYCADGVCCDGACNGICQSCTAALKGTGTDGTCGNTADGKKDARTSCADDGATSCGKDGYCKGDGTCRLYAKGVSCGASTCDPDGHTARGKLCDGTGLCLPASGTECAPRACKDGGCVATCASDVDCATNAYCDAPDCKPRKKAGEKCGNKQECESAFCVDGVCCNTPCSGQCEACDVKDGEGTCVPVAGAPHGSRMACAPATSDNKCSAAQCDGTERASCVGFVGASTVCRDAKCEGGVATLAGRCDGKGACTSIETKKCEPFACGGDTCKETCASDTDCATNYKCSSGKCISLASCDGDHTITAVDGQKSDCSPYKCTSDGACANPCKTTADCVTGFACGDGKCVSTASTDSTDDGGCGCRTAGQTNDNTGYLLAVAVGAVIALRRRGKR